MKNWMILLALCLITGAYSCSKNGGNEQDDKDGDGKPDGLYTQVKGEWEWLGKEWLHLPSNHGSVQNAFVIGGQPYVFYTVDLGAQALQKIAYYNGTSWVDVYSIGGTGTQNDYAVHQGKVYQSISNFYGSVVMEVGNNAAVGIDTISANSYNSYYVGSTGTSLFRVMCMPAPTAHLHIERWDGTDFVFVDSLAIDSIAFGLPDIAVEDGNGEIYIAVREVGRNGVKAYSYTDAGAFNEIATLAYDYGPKPRLFTYNSDLYIMEGPSNTSIDSRYGTIKRYDGNGVSTTVINYSQSDTFIMAVYPTPQGLVYTLGIGFASTVNTLTDIMLWDGTDTERYHVFTDSASAAAALPSRLVGDGNLYLGGVYFFYNNQLHVLGNAHSGVSGVSGNAVSKVYFARYNED